MTNYPIYVERHSYGIHVAKARGETMTGAYYSFPTKDGGYTIGGKHNYNIISKKRYVLLSIYYWIIMNIFPKYYTELENKSWKK